MQKVGILYIALGRYTIFWKRFYKSSQKYLLPKCQKHYFVFTDAESIKYSEREENIHLFHQEELGWPYNTLMRFDMFLKARQQLEAMDYLFFFNANLKVMKPITEQEFLGDQAELIFTIHPCFFDKPVEDFTYESNNPQSLAYIPQGKGEHYVMGALNGGKAGAYLDMIEQLNDNIKKDLENDIIAVWHDESHLNRYLLDSDDRKVKLLSPSYLYAEHWNLPFPQKILVSDKRKYGGHHFLRNKSKRINIYEYFKSVSQYYIKKMKCLLR